MAGLRRSLHFVPGANERMLEKSLALAADALVLDLEDAVTPDRKDDARAVIRSWLDDVDFAGKEVVVRANPLDTPWGRADVEALLAGTPPDALLVPKVRGVGDLRVLHELLLALERSGGHREAGMELIVIATETPRGALAIAELAHAERVSALTWGAEDLSAALGARRNRDDAGRYLPVFEHCRAMTLLSAGAAGVAPIDGVYVDFRDLEGLARECREGADMGFVGKMTIHPGQVDVVNAAFSPSELELADANELLAAFAEHERAGRMAFAFRGEMVDVPHLERARRIVARAEAIAGA
ncbi:MAG: CoA ester lyase [Pseudomonadales bacterium]|jgi:citrate lyase subunit beta/citryl-CoA lyase|nr:CoA ester lyase [Pseudomonadales bacterium]